MPTRRRRGSDSAHAITPKGCDLLIDVIVAAATSREIAVVASNLMSDWN
jgi:hypothetical protein